MLVKLTSCKNAFEGEVVKGMLAEHGIPCVLQNENMSHIYGGIPLMDVDVLVTEEDAERARQLLAARPEENISVAEPDTEKIIHTKKFQELTPDELYKILKLRQEVFVLEQQCIYPDMDDIDQQSWHLFDLEGDEVISYARVYWRDSEQRVAQIGRVVTDARYRRMRRAEGVMREAIQLIQEVLHAREMYLESQTYAIPFYERYGFQVTSEIFMEDGIPHVKMTREA